METNLYPLIQYIEATLEPVYQAIEEGGSIRPLGLRRSARLPVLAAITNKLNRPILLLTDRADRALTLLDELALWLPEVNRLLFPEPNPLFYENAAWGESTRRERLTALTMLAGYHIPGAIKPETPPVIVAPARAIMTRTLPRRDYLLSARTIKTGQVIQLDDLARICVRLGYEAVTTVIAPGQFARRGGLLDIWPPAEELPRRLDFFGNEIETIRSFEASSQRTIPSQNDPNIHRVWITPAREFLLPESQEQSEDLTPSNGRHKLSDQDDGGDEFLIPIFHQSIASILDYLPRHAIVFIDDQQAFEDAVCETEEQAVESRKDYIADGTLTVDFPTPYLTLSEINDSLGEHSTIELGFRTSAIFEEEQQEDFSDQISEKFEAGQRFSGRLKAFMDFILERNQAFEPLVIVSRQRSRLKELWDELRVKEADRQPVFIEGSLAEGWDFNPIGGGKIHLLTDGEIFGWRRPEPRRRAMRYAEAPEAGYSDLQNDDFVVHIDHGIGRFTGLVKRFVDGVEREYLSVEYADEAQLFVPVHQADRLTRYVGPDNRPPTLARLGSSEWRGTKSYVKEAVVEVAEELLELYAKRTIIHGHSFASDNTWQEELEASFPYIETDDQMRVLSEVKRDMESIRPMDRLICGDVGYGKTEVALRAAFKAVMDGFQVAILVPTTVLAQQHHHTFTERLTAFPVSVEMLSRFRTAQQQHLIVEDLKAGKIDIVIGTHRLLSSDVSFKNLGLLIIDEEQRFGVTHKEKLKQMRTEVDVLTLTATPIPRTLYLALSGVRDISTINTPPEERLPIITHVGPYSPRLVKQAILRELERGGQVFFVHNRVQTIGAMNSHLQQLIPEARISVAHGQMDETTLAERMDAFSSGEVDVLLSTSIIESGLDIPNANTLIVDRADTFGLAQLYQLRGRVGRGAQRAYAYFFRHNRKSPTLDGRQRLETIAENSQLGAGYSIAMRDLEIRGTGDILGTRQHGHIASVGFHLYTSMLSQAVQRIRSEHGLAFALLPTKFNLNLTPVNVELPLSSSIPADYVLDKQIRLGLYRRMADARTISELDALIEEFNDRFGTPPDAVNNLFLQFKIKVMAENAGLASLTIENNQFVLRFPDGAVPENLPAFTYLVRIGKSALWIPFSEGSDWMAPLVETLSELRRNGQEPDR